MIRTIRLTSRWIAPVLIGTILLAVFVSIRPASAINQLPTPDPKPGSYGLEATKPQPPPTEAATIATPGNGSSFSTSPITVSGTCKTGLLVQLYDNDVMVGSVMCTNGSFSLQISLFAGTNELSAIMYDDLEQAGPKSNLATVTYTDTRFTAFGQIVTLTSSYGRRSASATTELSWPLQLSGGTGPYAFSIEWGDGTDPELKSQSLAGLVTIAHVYKKAGIYQVNVKVTDANGSSAFLQLIAVSSGKVDTTTSVSTADDQTNTGATKILWIPAAIAVVLLVPTYWLGRRSQLVSLHNKMEKERVAYEKQEEANDGSTEATLESDDQKST